MGCSFYCWLKRWRKVILNVVCPPAKKNTVYWGNWSCRGWLFHQRRRNAAVSSPDSFILDAFRVPSKFLSCGVSYTAPDPDSPFFFLLFWRNKWENNALLKLHLRRVNVALWFRSRRTHKHARALFNSDVKTQSGRMPSPSFIFFIVVLSVALFGQRCHYTPRVNKASIAARSRLCSPSVHEAIHIEGGKSKCIMDANCNCFRWYLSADKQPGNMLGKLEGQDVNGKGRFKRKSFLWNPISYFSMAALRDAGVYFLSVRYPLESFPSTADLTWQSTSL